MIAPKAEELIAQLAELIESEAVHKWLEKQETELLFAQAFRKHGFQKFDGGGHSHQSAEILAAELVHFLREVVSDREGLPSWRSSSSIQPQGGETWSGNGHSITG